VSLFRDIKRGKLRPQPAIERDHEQAALFITGGAPSFVDVTGVPMEPRNYSPPGQESSLPALLDCWLEWRDVLPAGVAAGCRVRAYPGGHPESIGTLPEKYRLDGAILLAEQVGWVLRVTSVTSDYPHSRYTAYGEVAVPLSASGSTFTGANQLGRDIYRIYGGSGQISPNEIVTKQYPWRLSNDFKEEFKRGWMEGGDCPLLRVGSCIALHTFDLLNSSNVALEVIEASDKRSDARRRQPPAVGIRWHRLVVVRPGVKGRSAVVRAGSGEPLMAAHLARGHFKTFTAEAPLFGKYSGRFWWMPQVRGSKERGVVLKDYEVRTDRCPYKSGQSVTNQRLTPVSIHPGDGSDEARPGRVESSLEGGQLASEGVDAGRAVCGGSSSRPNSDSRPYIGLPPLATEPPA